MDFRLAAMAVLNFKEERQILWEIAISYLSKSLVFSNIFIFNMSGETLTQFFSIVPTTFEPNNDRYMTAQHSSNPVCHMCIINNTVRTGGDPDQSIDILDGMHFFGG